MLIIMILPFENIKSEKINEDKINSLNLISNRNLEEDVIIIPDSDAFFGIIGSSVACWYDTKSKTDTLLPLIVQYNGKLAENQERFIDKFIKSEDDSLLVLGESLKTKYKKTEIFGSPSEVALKIATFVFNRSPIVMIIPYNGIDSYRLGLLASPISSYLNIPILIYDDNQIEIQQVCDELETSFAYVVGDIQIQLSNITLNKLQTQKEIQNEVVKIAKDSFNEINYLTLTNPSDVIQPEIIETENNSFIDQIKNIQITVLGRKINIYGIDSKRFDIYIPNGINKIKISSRIINKKSSLLDKINPIEPVIFLTLYDPDGNIVSYSNSLAYDLGETYVETLTCNGSGTYSLKLNVYNGIKGGYFTQRGISIFNSDFEINVSISKLKKPHMPLIPKLSIMAPYLTSAHGGVIIADPGFSITTKKYTDVANGSASGPSYNSTLHDFNNEKVNFTLEKIKEMLLILDNNGLVDSYLNGPAWLAILGGTNMIPMYFYGPSQPGLAEKGLPSDNPYSLDWNLSVGRIVGWNVQDVSLLISRTFFYQEICGNPKNSRDWHNRFNFIFGEGFGETGGLFHQVPYALEIMKYGFIPRIFGDFKNSRFLTTILKTYTGSNYIEYLGHGDWFWFTPSLYGIDYYSKAIDVAHAKDWIFYKPSLFLSSACLMGRIDGIPPEMNIGLAMLHAGCNGFIGATRETGSEAGLEPFENHLILDDYSVGESLRGEKRIDKELPTYYVRSLYADPAFNPYEPNNGFSNQGRPNLT